MTLLVAVKSAVKRRLSMILAVDSRNIEKRAKCTREAINHVYRASAAEEFDHLIILTPCRTLTREGIRYAVVLKSDVNFCTDFLTNSRLAGSYAIRSIYAYTIFSFLFRALSFPIEIYRYANTSSLCGIAAGCLKARFCTALSSTVEYDKNALQAIKHRKRV